MAYGMTNAATATAQEVFDFVVAHARRQDKHAFLENTVCAYRSTDGLACFFGCLIPDEAYKPEFEGKSCTAPVIWASAGLAVAHVHLCRALQAVHDCSPLHAWETGLERVAKDYKLVYTAA